MAGRFTNPFRLLHPGAALLAALLAASSVGAAPCESGSFTKSHVFDDNDADGTPSPGDVLHYTLVFCEGLGDRRCAWQDPLPPELALVASTIVCSPSPGDPAPDVCREMPAGVIEVAYSPTRMARRSCTSVSFDADVIAAPASGQICNQASNTNVPANVSARDCEGALRLPDLELEVRAARPSVVAGGSVVFSIVARNIGPGPLVDGRVLDTPERCFDPLGLTGDPCDPTRVACLGPSCAAVTCIYGAGGYGFEATGIDLDASDGAAGGADEIAWDLTLDAGGALGDCMNSAETSDPDDAAIVAAAVVAIVDVPPACDLMSGDASFPPLSPPLGSLYRSACGPGAPRLADLHTLAAAPGDLADDFVSAPGTIRYYQLDCPCTDRIRLLKNAASGKVRLEL